MVFAAVILLMGIKPEVFLQMDRLRQIGGTIG